MPRKPTIIVNDIKEQMCIEWWGREDYNTWPLWIDDITTGIARLDWYGDRDNQIPLSTSHIVKCFLFLDEISTISVMELLAVKKSQATLYVKACSLCYKFFKESLSDKQVLSMKYPRQGIVSEAHGAKLGYDKQNRAFI